jgi:hypothetical protein
MPLAEISAAITSLNATLGVAKAMVGLRDAEAFRAKSIELQQSILDALESGIAAREAHAKQLDLIAALEAEVASLKEWGTEKQNYELKSVEYGSVAYMLKPDARGAEPPHWLCPTCFARGNKSFFLRSGEKIGRDNIYTCVLCKGKMPSTYPPKWID